jgi:hypothetical protein
MDEEKVPAEPQTMSEKTAGMERFPGFFTYYWDARAGKIWLEIDSFEEEFLYVNALSAGLGSNDVGLDRNQLGKTRIVGFHRIGPKVLMIQPNYSFRAVSDSPDEVRAVEDAFARAVIWGFEVEAEEEGRVLVDATGFLLRDEKGVVARLKEREQGDYELDESRSAIWLPETKNFPLNTEFEAILTYRGKEPGEWVKGVAVEPTLLTMRQHHSLIRLLDDGYEPRAWDPRSMYGAVTYMDFATPVDEPLTKRFIRRHRLRKKDPHAEVSDPVEPIVYHVDRGVPEPIRSALVEGAAWWNQAFEAIGYRDAFQVRVLPEGADPLDVRYNVINWVHRSTRGWSYGGGVTDPRTGEIIKGQVALGSQRVRQDFLIAQGLVADYEEGGSSEMLEMALARIRQLSVHEVGHTLGLVHNYASNVNDRSSVMDYPAPLVKIAEDGTLDLSEAYAEGIGEWDKVCIAYGYQDFPEGVDEEAELKKTLDDAFERGLLYAPTQDSGPGGAHPRCAPWVNGRDPVDELERIMRVRAIALEGFTEKRIRMGAPMATLEEPLVTTYLLHRYQLEAAASSLGGLMYHHKIRGDVLGDPEVVPGPEQRRALEALLETIRPKSLALPEGLLRLIPPRPPSYEETRDLFQGRTGRTFDPLAVAETAAGITVGLLLHPERAARLVEHHSRDPEAPGFGEVMDRLISATWKTTHEDPRNAEIQRVVDGIVFYNLVKLAKDENAASQVRSIAHLKLGDLRGWLEEEAEAEEDADQRAHYAYGAAQIGLFQRDPDRVRLTKPLEPPQGPPI